ncbi:precorrin-2 C(20)-methyltransferase [uncultured Sneathiella sp.]|jgi:precorrin-2/cobalt-factor-2 C20-methyltransferase|uniref:precorrin-2 C(20)-methyltransferase n=1 Tax=uncultured Sneathiella sp. TaxID=879315 RepID=UPI0030DD0FBE|tara:strand:+ start:24263 stop:24967 length:705 start_codon:yes stop_codon:yes gene_type:complete
MTGTLYGLGIGPGDPDLITVKALKRLQATTVLAYPVLEDGDSLARAIIAPHLTTPKTEIAIRIPMTIERAPAQAAYDVAAEELCAHLDAGQDVVVLCEGDPFFYGSFMYLFGRIAEKFPVEVIPGVSSLTACATALQSPLSARNDILTVLPAPLPSDILTARLQETDSAAIMKIGRHFDRVRKLIFDLGLEKSARYIERATMENEKIMALEDVPKDAAPYFSMILIHKRGQAWK